LYEKVLGNSNEIVIIGVHNNDDARKITIDDKYHLIGQSHFSNSNYL